MVCELEIYHSTFQAVSNSSTFDLNSLEILASDIDIHMRKLDYSLWGAILLAAVMSVFSVVGLVITFRVYRQYGWNMFHSRGADIRRRGKLP